LENITDKSDSGLLPSIARLLRIAPEGAVITLLFFALSVVCLIAGLKWLGGIGIVCALLMEGFFRDPERLVEGARGVVLSAADGKVIEVAEDVFPWRPAGRCTRVSVFMSLFDVHINRAPVDGEVLTVEHTPGSFNAAFRPDAGRCNESNLIVIGEAGLRHGIVQVAGCLARRIVCRLRTHDKVRQGQRIGLIMFGSRIDHFMPLRYQTTLAVGERVQAGRSIIGRLGQ